MFPMTTIVPSKSLLEPGDDAIEWLHDEHARNLLMNHKKLHLVLDLDHTLLDSAWIAHLSLEERYLLAKDHNSEEVHIIGGLMITKLRPYVRKFLERASRMFELSICTMGSEEYASRMATVLDPSGCIFESRIVSRECLRPRLVRRKKTDQKGLDVLPLKSSIVVILDDTLDVWRDEDRANVIEMVKYHFFKSSYDKFEGTSNKAYSELKIDECNEFGVAYLETVLNVLEQIHKKFFDDVELRGWEVIDRDVRGVLQMIKGIKLEEV